LTQARKPAKVHALVGIRRGDSTASACPLAALPFAPGATRFGFCFTGNMVHLLNRTIPQPPLSRNVQSTCPSIRIDIEEILEKRSATHDQTSGVVRNAQNRCDVGVR
jgi:hypothetical protein